MRSYLLILFYILCLTDATTADIYTLSLHDALPIFDAHADWTHSDQDLRRRHRPLEANGRTGQMQARWCRQLHRRSEEHTSELQSQFHLVCRLLLEKKK